MNTHSEIVAELKDKAYRDAFIRSQINVGIPFQARALRKKRNMSQAEVAEKAGMLQPRIAAIERPGGSKLNLETLLRLASALDVGLIVRFAPFSEVVNWAESFSPDSFEVPSFANDLGLSVVGEVVGQATYMTSLQTVNIVGPNVPGAVFYSANDPSIKDPLIGSPIYDRWTIHETLPAKGHKGIENLVPFVLPQEVPLASNQYLN